MSVLSSQLASRWKLVRELSKSGIVFLVVISVLAGYLIGQRFELSFDGTRMGLTLLGVLLLASGSSALNQVQEADLDAKMPRTAGRPLPSGRMGTPAALAFVSITVVLGIALLLKVSVTTCLMGLAALVSYNGLYTLWWKKSWAYAAIPGAIPGALPILIGYAAASERAFAPAGVYLFAILFFWQMPHFWVLALRFREDYRKGNFPTLPVAKGEQVTVLQIVLWCLAYCALALIAPLFLRVGSVYQIIALAVSAKVLWELRAFVTDFRSAPAGTDPSKTKGWLRFFLWVNFSLIFYLAAAVMDLWAIVILPREW